MILQPPFLDLRTFALALGILVCASSTARAQVDCSDDCYCTNECDTADDCQDGMVCRARLVDDCAGDLDTACIDGESDDECVARIEEQRASECQEVEVKRCDFYWSGACDSDADCGDERLECVSSRGCQPSADRCDSSADCAAMWSCRDVGGFCTEDTEEHGECIDGRFSYGVCSPAPYCGLQSGAAASGDDRSDEEQHRADMSADGANGAGSDEDPREREADDDATGRTAVSDATVDGGGCSLSTPTRASGASSWALAALSLVVFGGRRARRFPSQPRARLADVC